MSDDSDSFKASQGKHAQKIHVERAIMDVTGLSRSQLRQLDKFQEKVQDFQLQREGRVEQSVPRQIKRTTEQNFYPKTITQTRGGDVSSAMNVGTIEDVIIVFNGTGKYCIMNGLIGDDV